MEGMKIILPKTSISGKVVFRTCPGLFLLKSSFSPLVRPGGSAELSFGDKAISGYKPAPTEGLIVGSRSLTCWKPRYFGLQRELQKVTFTSQIKTPGQPQPPGFNGPVEAPLFARLLHTLIESAIAPQAISKRIINL